MTALVPPYISRRDAIVVHAAAAAAAIDATWLDVQVGGPVPRGNRCIRVFYSGEMAPTKMPGNRVLNGEMVADGISLIAFWTVSDMDESAMKAIDDEMVTFKHELRTRVLGDSQLGGASTDLVMQYATPDWVLLGSTRYAVLEVEFIPDYTEYTLAP